jgi:hypothetical protein
MADGDEGEASMAPQGSHAATEPAPASRAGRVSGWLSHPLLLLVAGAVLSSLLIPAWTRQWQDHQQELELKATVAGEIAEKVTRFLMTVQFVHQGAASVGQKELDAAYRQWEIDSGVIGSKLQSYFPDTDLTASWNQYAQAVTGFYALDGIDPAQRLQAGQALLVQIEGWGRTGGPSATTPPADANEARRYALVWLQARAVLLARKDTIIAEVLRADSAAF